MKDIVIVANFVAELQGRDNNRFSYLANLLSETATVELITSNFHHGSKSKRTGDFNRWPFRITLLEEPGYTKNISLRRIYSHMVFGRSVSKYLQGRKQPDLIYCAVPSLHAAKAAADYAKKHHIRFIVDIQDLWPEAFKMALRVPVVSDLLFAPSTRKANAIYAQADEIVAVSRTYCRRAEQVNTKGAPSHTVFLGTRLADFDAFVKQSELSRNKPADGLWLAYCGTLGSSYDLPCVFDALTLVKSRGLTPPKFIVMGDGPRKAEFEAYAKEKGLDVLFTGRLPYRDMCGLLCACDITVNPIVKDAAQSIINKHADYAACGLPVLNTQEAQEYRDLVDEYEMGFNCETGNAADLADKLMCLMTDPALRSQMGKQARRCAEERFDREYSYRELVHIVHDDMRQETGSVR